MRTLTWVSLIGIVLPLSVVLATARASRADDATAEIERLVTQLGADDFRSREEASTKLAAYGEKARIALEQAMRDTPSPEIRWRAEQLLRRLAGRDQETPLGADGAEPQAPRADGPPDFRSAMERMRKMFETWNERPGATPFGMLLGAHRVVAPALALEPQPDGEVKLLVERKDASGAATTETYTGHSLRDILARHPQLADHPGMEELRRREAESSWPGLEEFRKSFKAFGGALPVPNGSGFSFATSQGVEIQQDADGVTVKIRERNEKGEETVKEYKGESIEALKAKHPELADKIGGFSIRIAPPQIFWPGRGPSHLAPLEQPTTPRALPEGQMHFGLRLDPIGEALAAHLGLAPGKGALVLNVEPGSQAEALGVRRHDVIVRVNGQTVGLVEAGDLLREAGADKAAVTLELIRGGQALTLQR